MTTPKVATTISGLDPSGGAGHHVDIKVFHQCQVFGTGVLTLLTVQSTRGVKGVQMEPVPLVREQLEVLWSDIPPNAVKTGALGSSDMIEMVAEMIGAIDAPVVVDPVIVGKHGDRLAGEAEIDQMRRRLIPVADLLTPNRAEAAELTGMPVTNLEQMLAAGRALVQMGARHVVVKGGNAVADASDVLLSADQEITIPGRRVDGANLHGSGCVFSAAITAQLALGRPVDEAVRRAKEFVTLAIESAPALGHGIGPLNMHV